MADEVSVTIRKNGPYLIQGKIKLMDADGNQIEAPNDMAVLCRCGGSSNKPFCDGTHKTAGFEG